MRRIETLMKRLDEQDEFRRYLSAVRTEYKRKRNFMKLLKAFQ